MYLPKNPSHYRIALGADSAPFTVFETLDNPIVYETALIAAVVALGFLLLFILEFLRFCTEGSPDVEEGLLEEEEALSDDGTLVDNESGGKAYTYNGHWFNADGTEMHYNEWIENVYDPLD